MSGCSIADSDEVAKEADECNIAVDWEPTALYLRYQHSAELVRSIHLFELPIQCRFLALFSSASTTLP